MSIDMKRLKRGDPKEFDLFVREYEKQVYNIALRIAANQNQALDITQDVFIRAYRSLPLFKEESKLSTWLYRITHNLCMDYKRKEQKEREKVVSLTAEEEGLEPVLPETDPSLLPDHALEQKDRKELIRAAIASLSPEHRGVIILRDVEGFSYQEIAHMLQLEEGTVKSRISRAREKLREILIASRNFSVQNESN